MTVLAQCLLGLLGLLAAVVAASLFRKQTWFDRLLGLDMLGLLLVSILIIVALQRGDPFFLDLALALGGMGFVGTLAWARALEKP
jgi:multicomponent Na+:H+ antiporter subunit F